MRLVSFGLGLTLLCAGAGAVAGCSRRQAPAAPVDAAPVDAAGPAVPSLPLLAIRAERQAFRAEQDQRMRGPTSPLARVDYLHLPAGEHRVSAQPGAVARLSAERLAGYRGELRVRVVGGPPPAMSFAAEPAVLLNGQPATGGALRKGDTLAVGRVVLMATGLPDDPSLAVYDPEAPARRAYAGLRYFPDDDRYVVRARLVREAAPRRVRLLASRGEPQELEAVGELRFTLQGTACSLEAYREAPGSDMLFLIFRDATSLAPPPESSYGAGRFLLARLLADDSVVLDFNQAWNPLCAYSPYFHCPLPPRRNHLQVAIPVGERAYGGH
jgi:hypothetical protein